VYKLTDEIALIQTLDFFTPIVDDPFAFGQIAAANALSDVYAMGGRPICAMNIVCFPAGEMDISILQEILRGGLQKMHAADVTLAGGHSVEDPELKYGLSVTGIVHPERVLTNRGARPGDLLILTKPIGTGVLGTAVKGGLAREAEISAFTRSMATLNRQAAELIQDAPVHACTDITGFGLVGHLCEMIEDAETGIVIAASAVPLLAGAREYCEMGLLPAGLHRNREFRAAMVETAPGIPQPLEDLLFDPATSGGLLISLPARDARALLARLHAEGIGAAAVVGEAVAEPRGKVVITQ
jgi:selenide,water dikinase